MDPVVSVPAQNGGRACPSRVVWSVARGTYVSDTYYEASCSAGAYVTAFYGRVSANYLDAISVKCSDGIQIPLQSDNTGGSPWPQDISSPSGFTRIDAVASLIVTRLDFYSQGGQQVLPSIGSDSNTPAALDCKSNGRIIGLVVTSANPPGQATPAISSIGVYCSTYPASAPPPFPLPPSSPPPPPPSPPSPLRPVDCVFTWSQWQFCNPGNLCGPSDNFYQFLDPIITTLPQDGGRACPSRRVLPPIAGLQATINGFFCPTGAFITKIFGRWSSLVDAIGFECSTGSVTALQAWWQQCPCEDSWLASG